MNKHCLRLLGVVLVLTACEAPDQQPDPAFEMPAAEQVEPMPQATDATSAAEMMIGVLFADFEVPFDSVMSSFTPADAERINCSVGEVVQELHCVSDKQTSSALVCRAYPVLGLARYIEDSYSTSRATSPGRVRYDISCLAHTVEMYADLSGLPMTVRLVQRDVATGAEMFNKTAQFN